MDGMIDDDPELREVFKAETRERLLRLEMGLLRLEEHPQDEETLEEVFREAHNIKGSAMMLGLHDIAAVAHAFEDVLGKAQRGIAPLTPDRIAPLYREVDTLRALVDAAITGTPSTVDVASAVARLDTIPSNPAPAPAPASPGDDATPAVTGQRTAPSGPPRPLDHPVDTLRVDAKRLDVLFTQTGELTATKGRVSALLEEVNETLAQWEDLRRDLLALTQDDQARESAVGPAAAAAGTARADRLRQRLAQMDSTLQGLGKDAEEASDRLSALAVSLDEGIRGLRLVPLSSLFNHFPRLVRDLAAEQGKRARLVIEGGETTADKRIPEEMKDPLIHLLRNAVDHGIEPPEERERRGKPRTATVTLRAFQTPTEVIIEVEDDGAGIDLDAVKRTAAALGLHTPEELDALPEERILTLLFTPGFTTRPRATAVSGRGIGLDVVRAHVETLKGTVSVHSTRGKGCVCRLRLPLTLTSIRALLVTAQGQTLAIPLEAIHSTRLVQPEEVFSFGGRDAFTLEGAPIPLAPLATLLDLTPRPRPPGGAPAKPAPCVVLTQGGARVGLLVDGLVTEQELVLKPLSGVLKRVRHVASAALLDTGEPCIVLNPQDLLASVAKRPQRVAAPAAGVEAPRRKLLLLVEDSIVTRTQLKRLLETAGYEVVTAVDGLDALLKLDTRPFDGVVTDIQMPNMDGLTLTHRIRERPRYADMPIILVTTLATDADKRRGVEAGANAYLTKTAFDQRTLLDTLRRLV